MLKSLIQNDLESLNNLISPVENISEFDIH